MATCVEIGKADYPRTYQGQDIYPMEGKSLTSIFDNDSIDRDTLFWEHEGNRAVRQGDWKLVMKKSTEAMSFSMLQKIVLK